MEMLMMGACLSVFGLAVACLAFGAATRTEELAPASQPQPQPAVAKTAVKARFFVDPVLLSPSVRPRVPIEALLLQIENHVRLEQAAAESFLQTPTPALLHSRTISALVN
jgi:hypothetical protein